jgi:hypothetical protein
MQVLPSATLVLRDTLSSTLVRPVRRVLQIVPSAMMSPEEDSVTLALANKGLVTTLWVGGVIV